jgi:hypothetical protein
MWRYILGFGYLILYLRLFKAPLLFSTSGFLPHFLAEVASLFWLNERKRDTVRRRGDVDRRRVGTDKGMGGDEVSWTDANHTGPKNEKKSTPSIQLLQIYTENLKQ